MTVHGSCLCGGVSYAVVGELGEMFNCHCSRCRKAHGAMFSTVIGADAADLRWKKGEDLISEFVSEIGFRRRFCKICGGNLPDVWEDKLGLPAGALDDDPGIRPSFHIFVGSKAAFHEIEDGLPAHDEYPAEWEVEEQASS